MALPVPTGTGQEPPPPSAPDAAPKALPADRADRSVRKEARRGAGTPHNAARMLPVRSPDRRSTPIAAWPAPLASAKIVSAGLPGC